MIANDEEEGEGCRPGEDGEAFNDGYNSGVGSENEEFYDVNNNTEQESAGRRIYYIIKNFVCYCTMLQSCYRFFKICIMLKVLALVGGVPVFYADLDLRVFDVVGVLYGVIGGGSNEILHDINEVLGRFLGRGF